MLHHVHKVRFEGLPHLLSVFTATLTHSVAHQRVTHDELHKFSQVILGITVIYLHAYGLTAVAVGVLHGHITESPFIGREIGALDSTIGAWP